MAADQVAGARLQAHAGADIEGDHVARAVSGAADQVVAGARVDEDAAAGVAQRRVARSIGADEVPGYHVEVAAKVLDLHAVRQVTRDDVPLGSVVDAVAVGADEVGAGLGGDQDPVATVAQRRIAGERGSDVVAEDAVSGGAGALDEDAVLGVRRFQKNHYPR